MKTFLGIDLGTTSVKAMLLDGERGLLANASTEYLTHRSGDAIEQDPLQWLQAIEHCVSAIGEASPGLRDLAGVCVVSQVNTHLFTDDSFTPIAPAVTWQDQRSADAARLLETSLSDEQLAKLWPSPPAIDASFSLARWLWWKKHNKAVRRAAWMLSPKDFCIASMTGVAATDSFTPIGLVGPEGEYLGDVLGLDERFGAMQAPITPFDQVVAETSGSLGLPSGVPVACGTMDAIGSVIGSGVLEPGMGFQVSGTSEIIGVSGPPGGGAQGVVSFPPLGGCTVHAGPTQAGGQAVRWAASAVGLQLQEALGYADEVTLTSKTPLFLPHLDGERAPVWNADATGVWLGLSNSTSSGDLVLSAMEGVAFASRRVREVCETAAGVIPTRLRLSGGGSRSHLWNQLKASVHARPIDVLATPDTGALGACLIAMVATQAERSLSQLGEDLVSISHTVEPVEHLVALLDRRYCHYLDVYDSLVGVFADMAQADTV